jgi:N,N-dimethylformamidase beta subunit-like, C-terminal/Concanavalin A-like lectin/glucanases superfamily
MTALLGYCDPISIAPGERLRVMVSCIGAPRYDAEIVRLINPQAGPLATPFRTERVEHPASRSYPGRRQRIPIGSFGVVDAHPLIAGLRSFTLQTYVWPTTPGGRRQALLGSWSESERRGFGLGLDEEGALELRLGDGQAVARVTTAAPLPARRWHLVAGSFDAASGRLVVWQAPVGDRTLDGLAAVRAEATTTVRLDAGPGPFLFAAWHAGEAAAPTAYGRLLAGGHYNGKLDRPRLAERALEPAEIAALAGDGALPAGLERALVARWDFSDQIPSETLVDRSPNRLHGSAVNLPARAMTGHNWTGAVMDWTRAPEHYGAIHFHDDDLVDANWQPDFELELPHDLRSGVFAVRLSANEAEFYVPFFVRPPRGQSRVPRPARSRPGIAFLAATATYLAYINNRGRFASLATELYHGRLTIMDAVDGLLLEYPEVGLSTYDRHSDGSGVCYASRLRPATNVKPTGRHWNFNLDLFIIDWLEHQGVGYDVITEEDLHDEGLDLLRPYAVVLTGSHPEYDSLAMLDALEGYLRQGGRLMYMGGNGFYWRIAHHPTRRGVIEVRRAEGGVRAWDALPGEYYHSFTGEYGGLWRRQGRAPQQLAGVGFISQGFDRCSYYRRTPASHDPRVAFMFEGIEDERLGDFGVLQGGAAGLEIDCADPALGTPPHALVVARSEHHSNTYELVAEEVRIPHGATDAVQNPAIHADLVFFETPQGGAVFSTGSIAYAGSLGWNRFENNIARLTGNVLRRFADPTPFALGPSDGDG